MQVVQTTRWVLLGLLTLSLTSWAEIGVSVRPQLGYGQSRSLSPLLDGNISHLGTRFLLDANGTRKFGVELNQFQFSDRNKADRFYSAGIILEQTLFSAFKMSIGTVGYFRYGVNLDNPVGITTLLGWEPQNLTYLKPFITLRSDYIFHDKTNRMNALSLGLMKKF